MSPPYSAGLAHDVASRLVSTQSLEARVAEHALAGPLREADLGDELRPGPVHAALTNLVALERRGRFLQRLELPPEGAQHPVVEAGADLPRVHEHAVLVVAEQQRTER